MKLSVAGNSGPSGFKAVKFIFWDGFGHLMMASFSELFKIPTVGFVNTCKKEELLEIADHYSIVVAGKSRKAEIQKTILKSLFDQGVLPEGEVKQVPVPISVQTTNLTFKQQKELLLLQYEQERLCREARVEQEKRQREERLELERMKQNTERMKLDIEHSTLQLIKESKQFPEGSGASNSSTSGGIDVVANLRLVPRFNKRDPDSFFTLFEHVADAKHWPDLDRLLMQCVAMQCVLTGRPIQLCVVWLVWIIKQ